MIKIGDNYYRNLEEQVQKNKEDIANHYNMDRVLADFGIRILGRVDSYEELLKIPTGNLAYGDAYAVGELVDSGVQTPFVFYIWSRPDLNAGQEEPYWFDIGELAIVGPQGPQGEIGPRGERGLRGSKWYSGTALPTNPNTYEVDDLYLRDNGDVYQIIQEPNGDKWWVQITNIRGPQGATGNTGPRGPEGKPGEKGEKGNPGTTGALCNIVGEITSVDQLPAPTPATRYNGYLQEINGLQHLWVVVGPNNDLQWRDVGTIDGGGSKIIKNGMVLDEYDVSNVVVKGDFSGEGFVFHEGNGIFVTEPLITKLAGQTDGRIYAVPGRNLNGTMDVITDSALEEIVNTVAYNVVPEDAYPVRANEGCLRRNQAAPRGYVDALVAKKVANGIDDIELYVNNKVGKKISIPEAPTATIMDFYSKLVPQYNFTTNTVSGTVPRIKCVALPKNKTTTVYTDYIYYARGSGLGGLTFNYVKDGVAKSIKMTAAIMFPSSSGINGEVGRWLFGMLYVDSNGQLQLWNDRIEQNPYIENTALTGGLAYVFSYGMYAPTYPFDDNRI